MKIKNASCTCSTLRSFQRMFAQQAARGRLSTAVNIVTLPSGSVVMPLASAPSVPMVGIPSSRSRANRSSSPEDVPKIRFGRIPFDLASKRAGHVTDPWTDHGCVFHMDEVLHTLLVLDLYRRSHFEAFIEKAFFGDWSQYLLVASANDELSFAQRLKKTRARHPTCCRDLNAF